MSVHRAAHQKRLRFVDEYLIDLNGAAAAIRAGYTKRRSKQTAAELLNREDVQAVIAEKQAALSEKAGIKAEHVIAELVKLGFANMLDFIRIGPDGDPYTDFSTITRDQAAAIGEVTVEDFKDGRGEGARDVRRVRFKLSDKRGSLELLGKHLGLFKEQVVLSGTVQTETKGATTPQQVRDELREIFGNAVPAERAPSDNSMVRQEPRSRSRKKPGAPSAG